MESLPKDWLTQGLIDFEYKKYLLLAYLQTVKKSFTKVELYPFMADLVFHYRNLMAVKENKTLIRESFPKELSVDELHRLELSYRELIEDDAIMHELESIIEFAIPHIKSSLQEGSVIYEYVESKCEISAVGVTPLYAREGYLFVTQPPEKETFVYRYQMSIIEDANEQLSSLNTTFLTSWERTLVNTYEQMKLSLVRQFKDMPNPATYLIVSRLRVPLAQTLMPVAKRMFVKHLSNAA